MTLASKFKNNIGSSKNFEYQTYIVYLLKQKKNYALQRTGNKQIILHYG